ncbi:hypothetical protein G7Z17_g11743 [Cylindrodendrum hubeiense]|uniref:Telomeric single stranded DNA binding POT1/Cdc13 domain-containing protein n=1 Tax=Cylindrodendrum hubeiense TaxID=595255 RepID=A0A9P5GVC9_9HYPO|nr:hypothetical protein G7Z17_g11743 [Cylindrodendrum hubeiense]
MPDDEPPHEALRTAEPTPIALLNPDISDQKTRVVHGAITITWPFSIVTKSIAFIVAERDFRLRREKGQVRIRFHGAAAKAIADAAVGGGDEVRLSLDGAQWEKNETNTQLAGSTLEWQLEFTNRLNLIIKRADSQEEKAVVVESNQTNGQIYDATPLDEPPSTSDLAIPLPGSPEISLSTKRPASPSFELQEFASPAFIKRARVSYGSLFEGGLDIFDEDVGRKSKAKKKSRFSLPANAWRYSSRTPSPEVEEEPEELPETNGADLVLDAAGANQQAVDVPMPTPSRPSMVDEGCQTMDVDFTPMHSVQVSAESRPLFGFPYATPTPLPRTKPMEAGNAVLAQSLRFPRSPGDEQSTNELATGFLGQSPDPDDTGLTFGFTPSQPLLYPSATDLFPVSRGAEILHDPVNDLIVPEDYPTSFLDNTGLPVPIENHTNLPSQDSNPEPQVIEQTVSPFEPGPPFYAPFQAVSQPPQSTWPAGIPSAPFSMVPVSNAVDQPVEILSSSPTRERAISEDQRSSPSERTGLVTPYARLEEDINNNTPDVFTNEEDEEDVEGSSEEEQYENGGDQPGDDYDLRNYDRARADDDDVDESEEDPEPDSNDVEAQVIQREEVDQAEEDDNDEEEEEETDEEAEEYDGREMGGQEHRPFERDAEGEYYSDEEEYDEEDDEDDEEEASPSGPPAPKEPVFISLLSDSEDEDEEKPEPEPDNEPELHDAPEEPEELMQPEPASDAFETAESEESELAVESPEDPPLADEMDIDGKSSELSMPQNIAEDIDSTDAPHSETVEDPSTAIQRPLDESILSAPEQRDQDREQDPDPRTHVVGAGSPDQEVNVAPPLIEESNERVKDDDDIEHLERPRLAIEQPTGSTDAMEVDEPNEAHVERGEDSTAAADQEIADTTVNVEEARGTIINDAMVIAVDDQEGLGELPRSTGLPATPGNGVQPLPVSNAPAQEIDLNQESMDPTLGVQGQGHVESPDATMQDASQVEVVAGSEPPQAMDVHQTGNSEDAGETNEAQQLVTDGQMSPPATQSSQTQPLRQNDEHTLSQATSTMSNQELQEHLPTPGETQVEEVEVTENYHPAEERDGQTDEDDVGPEDQIMAEFLQHSPAKRDNAQQLVNPAPLSSPQPRPELTEAPRGTESTDAAPTPDVLITVKSLRSRGHRSTKSKSSDISQPDPSILLAKAPTTLTQPDDDVKASSPPPTLRITRSKADQADPSLQLARASTHVGGTKGKGRGRDEVDEVENSPPAKLRASRSRADHSDPSIQLAKGPPSSATRQSRRHATPEPIRETRSSSRGVVQRAATPDTVVSVLQSPSVAGSFAAAEDESVGAVKLQLLKSLRTGLPDFLSLKTLRNSLHQATDILGVATTTPAQPHRPKHGPRDYMLTLNLIDPSVAPTGVSVAHIFRPHLSSLPVVHAGDVVLLRRVQVVSMKSRGFGVRAGEASAWAVFEKADEEMLPQIKGPPVEVTEQEIKYVEGLRRWWNMQDDKAMEKIERASRKVAEAGKEDLK